MNSYEISQQTYGPAKTGLHLWVDALQEAATYRREAGQTRDRAARANLYAQAREAREEAQEIAELYGF